MAKKINHGGHLPPTELSVSAVRYNSKDRKIIKSLILKGIYKFETKSTSEYKDWAVNAPSEIFIQVLDEWKEGENSSGDVVEVEEYVKTNSPDWV